MNAASALPLFHVVGFTGHRNLADPAGVAKTITRELESLRSEAPGEWIAQSSAAAGADLIFVKAALGLGWGWEAVLPLPMVDFERDFEPAEWPEVKSLLGQAEHLEVAAEPGSREEAYLTGGYEIVSNCDLLLAVWDGQPARGKGGTADVVAYARAMDQPLVILNPETLEVTRENFDRLRLHDSNLHDLNAIAGDTASLPATEPREIVAAFQRKVDAAATHSAPHFRRLLGVTFALNLAAAVLAAAQLAIGWHGSCPAWGMLLCLLGALGVATFIRYQRSQHHWTRCRLAAEITRSALAIWGLPRAMRLFADFNWSGLEPLRRSLDVLHRRAARGEARNFEVFKQHYLLARLEDQLSYFTREGTRASSHLARLRMVFIACVTAAIALTAGYALQETMGWKLPPDEMAWLFHFAPILLPVLAAACIALIAINDLHRRLARYREMVVRLEVLQKEIAHSKTWAGLERPIAKAERVLLQELFEWHSVTSFSASL